MSEKLTTYDLLIRVRTALEVGLYRDTFHACHRKIGRRISRFEIEYVLSMGRHERRKDRFDKLYQSWNYAIRGRTIDDRDLRVIVSFDEDGMLIITAVDLNEKA